MRIHTGLPLAVGDELYVYALKDDSATIGLARADGGTNPGLLSLDDAALTIKIAQDLARQHGCVLKILPSAERFLGDAAGVRAQYTLQIDGDELRVCGGLIDAAE
jgi:hypothetical protein